MYEFESKSVVIYWDEVDRYVCVQWKGYATPQEFFNANRIALNLAKVKKADKCLADTRNATTLTPESQKWMDEFLMPQLIKAGIRKMCLITPEKLTAERTINKAISGHLESSLTVRFFDDYDEGKKWLTGI